MKGLLCNSSVRTNDEYRGVIKVRMHIMVVMFLIGLITLTVSVVAKVAWEVSISDQMLGVYTGVGSGLTVAAIVLWIKNKRILADEDKIKQNRLSNTDERLREINSKAFRVASIALLVALYAVGLVGGLFYPILVKVLAGVVSVFILVFFTAYKIFEKRM